MAATHPVAPPAVLSFVEEAVASGGGVGHKDRQSATAWHEVRPR